MINPRLRCGKSSNQWRDWLPLFARVQLRILGLLGRTPHHLDSNNYQSEYCTLLDQARETRVAGRLPQKRKKPPIKVALYLI